jgi:hypothetical protein
MGKRSPSIPAVVPLEAEALVGPSDLEVSLELWEVVLEGDGLEDGFELEGEGCEGGKAEVEG